jgi:N-acyl-L-homoserine lactone synthetase
MTIECVTIATNHLFAGNPIAAQHRLRYRTIIKRQNWSVPQYEHMEYDQFDNPATTYLIWRDDAGEAKGVSRLYPTDRPFMLQERFSHMVTHEAMPCGSDVLEGSRFCIDHTLDNKQRERVARELVLAYLEFGLDHDITRIIGLMYPIYWHNLFIKIGWKPFWLGEAAATEDGKRARAGGVIINQENLAIVRNYTGFNEHVINYGDKKRNHILAA